MQCLSTEGQTRPEIQFIFYHLCSPSNLSNIRTRSAHFLQNPLFTLEQPKRHVGHFTCVCLRPEHKQRRTAVNAFQHCFNSFKNEAWIHTSPPYPALSAAATRCHCGLFVLSFPFFHLPPPSNCWLPFQWETDGRPLLWATAKWSKFSLQRLQALFILSKPHLHPLHHFAIWCVQHLFPMQTCHFAMPRFADYRIFITLSTEWQKQTSFVLWGCLEWSVASLLGLGNKMISIIIMNKFPQYR